MAKDVGRSHIASGSAARVPGCCKAHAVEGRGLMTVMVLQGSPTDLASASAAAISAAVEGSPQTAEAVAKAGGLDMLLSIMRMGSPRCKTSAVEALQVPESSSISMTTCSNSCAADFSANLHS